MFLTIVQFGYLFLFILFTISVGHTIVGETGSDAVLMIEFQKCPLSCQRIPIDFYGIKEGTTHKAIIIFYNYGDKCSDNINREYWQRIHTLDCNLPRNVTFTLRNISFHDTGKYYASDNGQTLGETILLVSDKIVRTCALQHMELFFLIPLYASKEVVEVLFYSGRWLFASRISICNPEVAACDPPKSYYRRWECRIKGNTISLKHKSVQFEDQGIYAVVATNLGILYDSAILNITNHSILMDGNYFVSRGVVTGIVIVTLTCQFLYKRWCQRRVNGAVSNAYDTIDAHYYSTICNQHQRLTESVTITCSVPEQNQRIALMGET